jgi:dGTPase
MVPWAQRDATTRGRRHPEPEHPFRLPYARDRDRIIHCRAFRRLEYKTQVFVNHEGDHYRTRLTHSIEVAQIARTVSRALGLNGDLAESLALSHDLGHTPFGHLGEEVLHPLVADIGGFEHNRQSLRIVEVLERRYPDFPGLNLTWEVREGIAKHSGPPDPRHAPEFAEYHPEVPPPLEAQIIDLVDEIAYNHHDIEDGLESGLLDLDGLVGEVPLFGEPFRAAARAHPESGPRMWIKIALRRVIDRMVTDLVRTTEARIESRGIGTLEDVRAQGDWLAGLSEETVGHARQLKRHLHEVLYQHPRIQQIKQHFARVLEDLFEAYRSGRAPLPPRFAERAREDGLDRAVVDYIAGMTDRFAMLEHRRLCDGPGPDVAPSATRP